TGYSSGDWHQPRDYSDGDADGNYAGFTGDAAWIPAEAGNDYFWPTADNGERIAAPLRGLTAQHLNTIDLIAATDNDGGARIGDYYVLDSSGNMLGSGALTHDAEDNTSEILSWTFAAPSDGRVWVVGDSIAGPSGDRGARLNAMRINVVP